MGTSDAPLTDVQDNPTQEASQTQEPESSQTPATESAVTEPQGEQSAGDPSVAPSEANPGDTAPPGTSGEAGQQQTAQADAVQDPGSQVVPEQRPQAFQSTERVSDSSKRLDGGEAMPQEAYDRANSDEAKEEATKNSRSPNLLVGQRVVIQEPHSEAGRMAYVLQVIPEDGIQGMLLASGTHEARFAGVQSYVVRTRDGRTDTLDVKPEEVRPLDDTEGWGRGQI